MAHGVTNRIANPDAQPPHIYRYVYSTPGDAQLSAVDVKGDVFLAWAQMALAAPPFFMQVSRVDIGRDQNREPQCQINMMQVRANRKTAAAMQHE